MIKISSLTIRDFRGIRSITLDLGSNNFAVCGPNGSGKSGVVDAIEFVLTGDISRLAGKGTGGLSVKEHGPHVDSTPEYAFVEAEVVIAATGKSATIRRTVKQPKAPMVTPDDPSIRAALAELAAHPEFVLSRREIIKFVLAEPSARSQLVQALLRLDELDTVRANLTKIANAEVRDEKAAIRHAADAGSDFALALGIPKISSAPLLIAVNTRRTTLGLPPLNELTATTSVREGLQPPTSAAGAAVNKTRMLTELKSARERLEGLATAEFEDALSATRAAVGTLEADVSLLQGANRENMLRAALALYDDECPVCGTEFELAEFQTTVTAKLAALSAATAKRQQLENALDPIADALDQAALAFKAAANWSNFAKIPIPVAKLAAAAQSKAAAAAALRKLLPIEATKESLATAGDISGLRDELAHLDAAAALLPDPSTQDAAREYLVIAQSKLESWRKCRKAEVNAKTRAELTSAVSATFGDAITDGLEAIFDAVRSRFGALYRAINHDDESAFDARFKQVPGRLALDVDFYGRGFFPPGAYHSEGHQDGMGLCLYLALTDHLLGQRFSIAVLDDVLMSVDSGHRREFSRLLKTEFPHTQFILTTHDPIWLKHMASEGLVGPKGSARFRKWDVDHGPAEWDTKNVWAEIDSYLALDDVPAAAGALRRYLEYLGEEVCHRLRARVEFRADAQFMLGDTLPHGLVALGDAYKRGRVAAGKWNKPERVEEIKALESAFVDARTAANVDQWQVNTAVHYNSWANLSKPDFIPVVDAYRALVASFHCGDCGGLLRVSPERGPKESVRCSCGTVLISLVEP